MMENLTEEIYQAAYEIIDDVSQELYLLMSHHLMI